RFRKDLLYRLNTVVLTLPPLRDRREDIVPMARMFLRRSAIRYGRRDMRLSSAAEQALAAYPWPGNVRELAHLMERAVRMAGSGRIEGSGLGLSDTGPVSTRTAAGGSVDALDGLTLDAAEERLVRQALERSRGNIQRAADLLGLSRPALYRRLE